MLNKLLKSTLKYAISEFDKSLSEENTKDELTIKDLTKLELTIKYDGGVCGDKVTDMYVSNKMIPYLTTHIDDTISCEIDKSCEANKVLRDPIRFTN